MKLTQHDLGFILNQIKIAEANSQAHSGSNAKALTDIWVDNQGNTTDPDGNVYEPGTPGTVQAMSSSLHPYGLRTVNGSYNNFVVDRELYGSSGQPFLRLTDPHWVEGTGTMGPGFPDDHSYEAPGDVVDSAPRTISNLIVDQTPSNPAAIITALQHAGYTGNVFTAVTEIQAHYATLNQRLAATNDPAIQKIFKEIFDGEMQKYGIEMDGITIFLPNVAPDDGISASYNAFFAAFGQFFDHGLDLVAKGGNGTVYMPLQPDDPLYVAGSPTNFMVMTRATTGENARNITTPWVDQNQTYTSDPSHQLFLREYAFSVDTNGDGIMDANPIATGKLLEGSRGLATWADVKKQARELLGIELSDKDVTNVPVMLVDPYGEFVRGPNGLPQVLAAIDANGNPIYVEGNLGSPIDPSAISLPAGTVIKGSSGPITLGEDATVSAVRTGHAFLDDIAHVAAPKMDAQGNLLQDSDSAAGYSGESDGLGQNIQYDNELLDAHYITGDGRGNENIGLSVVHHIFHSEHNRVAEHVKEVALQSGDRAFLNDWLRVDLTEAQFQQLLNDVAAAGDDLSGVAARLQWDGERVFQAARFTTEMEYQHLVFEEFARKIQPDIDAFAVWPDAELNPAIYSEFADVVYRFGHSMLNERVPYMNADGSREDMSLFDAFLNPLGFGSATIDHNEAAGAILRGMTTEIGNEIDEFVTNTLRNQLLGIPLDLAATNITRARDNGTPTLNIARAEFMEMAQGDTQLKPYESWTDFALNLKNSASIINFVAAYGTHATLVDATTLQEKRDAAFKLVMGGAGAPSDRLDFLNGTGAYAGDPDLGGLQNVDLWVGGLAEQKMSFGGMLGSTFSFIFEMQLEALQNADRFYYLARVQGLNLLTELEANSLAKMALRNTDLGESGFALPSDIFSTPGVSLYMDYAKQLRLAGEDPEQDDPVLEAFSPMVERRDANNDGVAEYLRYNGDDHVVIMGSDGNDHIIAGKGDDTIWGGKGNDRIEAGYGVDRVHGGEGDDIITNSGTDIGEVDMLHGDEGNDVIHGGSGMALIFGGSGKDFLMTGPDGSEVRAGTGDDFVLGGDGADTLFGNEGDDWIEAGGNFDYIAGDNGDLFFNSRIIGHDVLNGGSLETDYDADSGDDIMHAGEGIQKFIGMWGHDWVVHKGQATPGNADMNIVQFPTLPDEVIRDRYSQVESVSGWIHDDVIKGDDRTTDGEADEEVFDPTPEGNFKYNELDREGIARIQGLDDIVTEDLLQLREYWADGSGAIKDIFVGGNILLGGGGSDRIEGRGGDDLIDGDAWLNTRISIRQNRDGSGNELATVDSMKGNVRLNVNGNLVTKPLTTWMLEGVINPGQLKIVREILYDDSGVDTAVYWDNAANYEITYKEGGRLVIDHTGFDGTAVNPITGQNRVSDGTDIVRNIEVLEFADTRFNIVMGSEANDRNTSGKGTLVGSEERDIIMGLGGHDTLQGNGGDDILYGGAGNDNLNGGTGNDILYGGTGNDTLNGAAGDDELYGDEGDDTLNGGAGNDILNGGLGNDVLSGGNGDDTLMWEVGGGRDIMDGGAGNDTVRILGSTASETFIVYDRTRATQNGITGLAANTEIVITRNGAVIAELDNIEEIVIDGAGGDDFFAAIGNFTGTSLAMSTITLVGSDDDDIVDISELESPHRIVFRSNGGSDTIRGALRPQDVVHLAEGTSRDDYEVSRNVDGTSTLNGAGHAITFSTTSGLPGLVDGVEPGSGGGDEEEEVPPPPPLPSILGTMAADVMRGTDDAEQIFGFGGNDVIDARDGDDVVYGGDGNDVITGGAGNDTLHGEDGNDQIQGGDGNDIIVGGAGNDTAYGGNGDDTFIAEVGDGNDSYFGDAGSDTLDMSRISADTVVQLSATGVGSAQSKQSGNDKLYSIENVRTGSGNDTIHASDVANVMDGGAGADTFVFASVASAKGDIIVNFEAGDIIDLSRIDANTKTGGNQAFVLKSAPAFSGAAGELLVRAASDLEGKDITLVEGDVNGDGVADFQITLLGLHSLDATAFVL